MNTKTDSLLQNNMAVFFSQVSWEAENNIKIPRSFSSFGIPQSNADIHSLVDLFKAT